jgi:menaquinone-dependent protoporphyrinogen IX oxidase
MIRKSEVLMERRTFLNLGIAGLGTTVAMASPVPFQFIPNPSKEKWAVLYGTWYGTSRDASIWISEGMGGIAAVFDVRQVPSDLEKYDHLVVGTSIQSAKGRKELQAYLEANAGKLKNKIRGLFAVCGNRGQKPGPQQTTDLIDNYLAKLCQVGAVPKHVFGGRITKSVMPPDVYQSIEKMYGSMNIPLPMDNLSRSECLQFGNEILAGKA